MDLLKLAEPFPADDIEWRVQSSGLSNGNPWARVLAYVTARAIMARLDEVVGPENWKPRYTYEGGGVMCHLAIRTAREVGGDELIYWVEKADGAEQTDIEKFKGGISSALKRAGAVWGIGRYLYKLESGFAECDKNTKRHPNYGKTKDGTQFSWAAPELPEWALPKEKKKTKKAQKEERDSRSEAHRKAHPDVVPLDAAQLREIGMLRSDIGVSEEAYRSILLKDFGVESTKDLPAQGKRSAAELIDRLMKRKAFMLEQEAKETFGDSNGPGRVPVLRASALGFCNKVRTMGGTYQDGSPIDYKEEGLIVTTLEELVELVGAMSDEKELEGVVTRLDALVQTMSF